jgi:uncharacterized membrane protein HdeD (DUF308 family)
MRFLQHAAVLSVFAIIAAVIVFARPQKSAVPITWLPGARVAVFQK